ncbi:hypothetical protein HAX54_041207, partial [Datura stramonium]|nr:hypothetical protein [Datura stramonium]
HLKETKIMEDLNSKGAAEEMLLTGEMRIQTCEMQVGLFALDIHLCSPGWYQLFTGASYISPDILRCFTGWNLLNIVRRASDPFH